MTAGLISGFFISVFTNIHKRQQIELLFNKINHLYHLHTH